VSQRGIVIYNGKIERGGNIIAVLGPLFRIHYYANLQASHPDLGLFVSRGDTVGYVGTSGNAQGSPPASHQGARFSVVPVHD